MTTIMAMYVIFGLLMVALAIPLLLDKVPPNPWYGFRVPSTLSDPVVWYKANRYMARWLLLTGVITTVGAFLLFHVPGLTVDTYAWLALTVFGVPFLITIVTGFRYLRKLPK
jgi:uncharacterized membrane protein